MKYLKTFENYEHLNEEFLGLDNFFNKIKNSFKGWKNKKQKELSEFLIKAINENKDNPKLKELFNKLKEEFTRLPDRDKETVRVLVSSGRVPHIPKTKEEINFKEDLSESLILEGTFNNTIAKILKWLGLSIASTSFVTLLIAVAKIVIANSAYPTWIFDMSLGSITAVLMVTTFASGLLMGIGSGMEIDEEENDSIEIDEEEEDDE